MLSRRLMWEPTPPESVQQCEQVLPRPQLYNEHSHQHCLTSAPWHALTADVEKRFWRMIISSPVSFLNGEAACCALGGGCVWRIDREVQHAYFIINCLWTGI
jgi:hypothetical protein